MKIRVTLLFLLGLLAAAITFAAGYAAGQGRLVAVGPAGSPLGGPADDRAAFAPLWEVYDILQRDYYARPVDAEALAEGAVQGMLAALDDPHSRYLSPDDEQAARQAMEGNIEGIGAEVAYEDGRITIVAPYEGSPAAAAGLKPGDVLLAADGVSLVGMDMAEAIDLVRGPAGTSVRLLVGRDGDTFEVLIERDVIRVPSVYGEMLDVGIAYVRLSRFGNTTAEELADTLRALTDDQPMGMILDLRGNPGGGLEAAVDVADHFLDEGLILVEEFGEGREKRHRASSAGLAEDVPLVVLVDEGSASASEVIAGAISDRERGVLIGTTTYGKGTVQTWRSLSNGGGVRITIARWLTPDGRWIQDEGLEPDFHVAMPEAAADESADTQLEAAVDYLIGRPFNETPVTPETP